MNNIFFRLLFFLFFPLGLFGQQSEQGEAMDIYINGSLFGSHHFKDSLHQRQWITTWQLEEWSDGFLFSDLDSINEKGIYLHKGGQKYVPGGEVIVHYQDQPADTLDQAAFGLFSEKLLNRFTNNGYPFASMQLKAIALDTDHNRYLASISLDAGPKIVYDTLHLVTPIETSASFIANALSLQPGEPYRESVYRSIPEKLKRLPYLELRQKPDIGFTNGKATIHLDLDERSTNSFEGILGLLPNQSTDQSMTVTGYLDLELNNLFKSGKSLSLLWNRFAESSQSLEIGYVHPQFLSPSLLIDAGFSLMKQDSSFLTQTWELGAGTYLGRRGELVFNFQNIQGSLINAKISSLEEGLADYSTQNYALLWRQSGFNRPFEAANRFEYAGKVGVGKKEILKNAAFNADVLDTLTGTSVNFAFSANIKYQRMLSSGTALYHHLRGGMLINDQIMKNELTRLGGLKTIRGFNENFFYAKNYASSRMELRQYFEQNSFFMLFYDQVAFVQRSKWKYPFGFGTGFSLQTTNGLFSFAMALGGMKELPVDVSNVKVHIGYTSRF